MYFIALLLMSLCGSLHSMDYKWRSKQDKATIEQLTSLPIIYVKYNHPLMHAIFSDIAHNTQIHQYFYRVFNDQDELYFIPINLQSGNLSVLATSYKLLDALQGADRALFDEIAKQALSLQVVDKRYAIVTYQLYTKQHMPATLNTINQNSMYPLMLGVSTKQYPGKITLDWTSLDHAKDGGSTILIKKIAKSYGLPVSFHVKHISQEIINKEQEVMDAFNKQLIPHIAIENQQPPEIEDTMCQIYGINAIEAHIHKDYRALYNTSISCNPLDTVSLAALYALIITYNKLEGSRLASLYTHWSKYPFLSRLVLRYVIDQVKEYKEEHIVFENLIVLVEQILKDKQMHDSPLNSTEAEILTIIVHLMLLENIRTKYRVIFFQLQDLLASFTSSSLGKAFLKKLCSETHRGKFFSAPIKPLLYTDLLKRTLLLLLLKKNSPFKPDIAQQVIAFWRPDDIFIESLRKELTIEKQYAYTFYE